MTERSRVIFLHNNYVTDHCHTPVLITVRLTCCTTCVLVRKNNNISVVPAVQGDICLSWWPVDLADGWDGIYNVSGNREFYGQFVDWSPHSYLPAHLVVT